MYDVAVIGGGAAGISAALTLKTYAKRIIWLSDLNDTPTDTQITNYPGLPEISEKGLFWAFCNHYERMGLNIIKASVTEIYDTDGKFDVFTRDCVYGAKCVVLCTGKILKTFELVHGLRCIGGAIEVDRGCSTNIRGIFAAGDCTGKPYGYPKAVGEGFVAACSAAEYLSKRRV